MHDCINFCYCLLAELKLITALELLKSPTQNFEALLTTHIFAAYYDCDNKHVHKAGAHAHSRTHGGT